MYEHIKESAEWIVKHDGLDIDYGIGKGVMNRTLKDIARAALKHIEEVEKKPFKPMNPGDKPLVDGDEGELNLRVAIIQGKLVLDFGKSVAWIGLDADSADQFGDMLKTKAKELRGS